MISLSPPGCYWGIEIIKFYICSLSCLWHPGQSIPCKMGCLHENLSWNGRAVLMMLQAGKWGSQDFILWNSLFKKKKKSLGPYSSLWDLGGISLLKSRSPNMTYYQMPQLMCRRRAELSQCCCLRNTGRPVLKAPGAFLPGSSKHPDRHYFPLRRPSGGF